MILKPFQAKKVMENTAPSSTSNYARPIRTFPFDVEVSIDESRGCYEALFKRDAMRFIFEIAQIAQGPEKARVYINEELRRYPLRMVTQEQLQEVVDYLCTKPR